MWEIQMSYFELLWVEPRAREAQGGQAGKATLTLIQGYLPVF